MEEKQSKKMLEEIESFQLPVKYADMLLGAIQKYSRDSMIQVDSIFILKGLDGDETATIEIQPTQALHLFNVFKLYGQIIAEQYINEGKNVFGLLLSKLKPADFILAPIDSVLRNSEAESIAKNIMVILSRTKGVFRDLTWDEYRAERLKDSNFNEIEKDHFNEVIRYCKSPETAKLFSSAWNK